jgi:hypothetical protein
MKAIQEVGYWLLEVYIEIGLWLLGGAWYEVALKVSGVIGLLLLLRQIHFGISELSDESEFISYISSFLFLVVTFAWILLIIVLVYLIFFR